MSHDVSVLNGRHAMLAVGPFRRHGDALSHVDAFRRWAEQRDRWAAFYAFGPCYHHTAHPPGQLNDDYGVPVAADGRCHRIPHPPGTIDTDGWPLPANHGSRSNAMNGYWMTFTAHIRTRPDVTDVDTHLAYGVQALRAHPDIADAAYRHDRSTHTVAFHLLVSYPVHLHHDVIRIHRALLDSLEQAGFGDTNLPAYSPVPVRLRFGSWPDAISA
jgi:hypothetical protein